MKIVSSPARRACVVWCALWWAVAASAADPSSQRKVLTLAEAIELALERSPSVAALESEAEALEARNEALALPPNPVLESELENFGGTGNPSAAGSLETTLRLSRVFELGNKPALRRGIGTAELQRLTGAQRLRRLDLAAEVARRFIHVISDQEQLEAARRATELARTATDVVRRRVEAGASSPTALSRSQIALARAGIAQEHAEHELASSRMKLSVLWGDAQARFGPAAGGLFELPALEPFDTYRSRLDASPDLEQFVSDARVQDARLRLAAARRSPDIEIAAGIRRLEAFDDQALVASFSVPLGTRRRADLERRSVQADRNRVDQEYEARRLELHATLFDLYQEIVHARTEAEALHEQIRPQAAAMLATTDEGYRAGRFSLLELADAQGQLLEVERDAIRAAAQFHTLLIEIQRVTGEPIRTLEARRSP